MLKPVFSAGLGVFTLVFALQSQTQTTSGFQRPTSSESLVGALPSAEIPELKATQVTMTIERDGRQRRFRATIVGKKDLEITLFTAAHCLVESDIEGPAHLITADNEVLEASVLSVIRNPAYRNRTPNEIRGTDNAITRVRLKAPTNSAASRALDQLRPVEALPSRPYPSPGGQTIAVRMIDAKGVEHALKAGNHRNPRYLEWGPSYKPIPGDSGGGVFVIREIPNARPQAILIGTIVGQDERGGAASLVSHEMKWVEDALAR